jgi:hypothetical protein
VYLSRKHCRCVQMLMESEGAEGRKVGRNVWRWKSETRERNKLQQQQIIITTRMK